MKPNVLEQRDPILDRLTQIMKDVSVLIGEKKDVPINLGDGAQILTGIEMIDDAETLTKNIGDINQGLFTLLVVGEFKNGKSTLINAILGKDAVPARAVPTTAIITVLVYGERDNIAVYRSGISEPEYFSWSEFAKEFTLTPHDVRKVEKGETLDRFRNIDFAQIETTNAICANRVRLVDSPGLGEHISRTRIVKKYLRQAQAVIYVANAMHILGENERTFITEELGAGRLENVFFVVNRINQIEPRDVESIKEWVKADLNDHFLDEEGNFDEEFYNKRVFFVNAFGALEARKQDPVDFENLRNSHVDVFEHELQQFLNDGNRASLIIDSILDLLTRIHKSAKQRIELRQQALQQPVETLNVRKEKIERQLVKLQDSKERIFKQIMETGESIFSALRIDLFNYIKQMHRDWPNEPEEVVDLSEISSDDIVNSFKKNIARHSKKTLEQKIDTVVSKYLKFKFNIWSRKVQTEEVLKRLDKLRQQTGEDINHFMEELTRLRYEFALGDEATHEIKYIEHSLFDPTYLSKEAIIAGGDWSVAVESSMQTFLAFAAKVIGQRAIVIYAWLHTFVKPFVEVIDEITGLSVGEKENRKHMGNLRRELGQNIYKTLDDDFSTPFFKEGSIRDLESLVSKIRVDQSPISSFLREQVGKDDTSNQSETMKLIHNYTNEPEKFESKLRRELVEDLKNIIQSGESIYTPERFKRIKLQDQTLYRAKQENLSMQQTTDLNRWLLSAAYPDEIAPKLYDTLYHSLMFEFRNFAYDTTKPLQTKIDEISAEMESIISDLEDKSEKGQREISRLKLIEKQLDILVYDAHNIVNNNS